MPLTFFSLPSEVRNTIYELLLLRDKPINAGINYSRPQHLTPGLFRANKAVHREAASLFYAGNRFELLVPPKKLSAFLNQIGPTNARSIRHISIPVPTFSWRSGEMELDARWVQTLSALKSTCPKLQTITIAREHVKMIAQYLFVLGVERFPQVMQILDGCLRDGVDGREIAVEVGRKGLAPRLRGGMEMVGWTVKERDYGYGEDGDYEDDELEEV